MKNQKVIFVGVDEFTATQFFENDTDGIDISIDGKHIGEIWNIAIPDIDEVEDNVAFDNEVENWLTQNYY